jgi:quinol monooxygenase YgiN
MDGCLIVVAEMKAKPGLAAELRRRTVALIEPTRREAGCLQYDLHECEAEPERFLFYEIWASRAAWEAHLQQPHLVEFLGRAADCLAEPVRVSAYVKLA